MSKRNEMRKRVDAVWQHGALIGEPFQGYWRYEPRSFSGGTGWGVFDRKQNRFVEDSDLMRVPVEQLSNEKLLD